MRDEHFATGANCKALQAEAMVRAVCGESVLLAETHVPTDPGTGLLG